MHAMGQAARTRLNAVTESLAGMLGVLPDEVVLTSGATEANNMAILGLARAYRSRGSHVITTPMEHASVTAPVMALKAEGFAVDFARVLPNGQVDIAHLKTLLREDTVLLSVCAVDGETGVAQPLAAIRAAMGSQSACRLHVDATQAVGKLPVDLSCADLFTCSPHKFYGVTGVGLLAVHGGLRLAPLAYGGLSATPYRSGTPTLALAASAEAALAEALAHLQTRLAAVQSLNAFLWAGLAQVAGIALNSPPEASPYILNFSVSTCKAQGLLAYLSENGVCASSKAACCAPASPSHPVLAMTGERKRAMNTVRVSLSHLTTQAELATFCDLTRRYIAGGEAFHGSMPAD